MFLLLITYFAWAAAPNSYTDINSVEALRTIKKIATKPYKSLKTEADQVEWVKARLAWIALERLRGQEDMALIVFEDCEANCEKHAPEKEWSSLKAWGCAKKKEAITCLPLSTKKLSTKAQKSPL